MDFSNQSASLKDFVVNQCTNTGGGDFPECYELVLHKMQELSWAATSAKALAMIGDAPPHQRSKYDLLNLEFIDWREELKWYTDHEVHVYGVKCGGSSETFYDNIAKETDAMVLR